MEIRGFNPTGMNSLLNGEHAIVVSYDDKIGKYAVRLDSQRIVSIKPENLTNLGVEVRCPCF